jgi:hypothetical protein
MTTTLTRLEEGGPIGPHDSQTVEQTGAGGLTIA